MFSKVGRVFKMIVVSIYCLKRNSDQMTTVKTHPTLDCRLGELISSIDENPPEGIKIVYVPMTPIAVIEYTKISIWFA